MPGKKNPYISVPLYYSSTYQSDNFKSLSMVQLSLAIGQLSFAIGQLSLSIFNFQYCFMVRVVKVSLWSSTYSDLNMLILDQSFFLCVFFVNI